MAYHFLSLFKIFFFCFLGLTFPMDSLIKLPCGVLSVTQIGEKNITSSSLTLPANMLFKWKIQIKICPNSLNTATIFLFVFVLDKPKPVRGKAGNELFEILLLLPRSIWWLRWLDSFSRECRISGCQEQILCRPPELGFEGHTSGPYLLPCLLMEWAGL